jgi:hypothetical protein
MKHLTVLCTVLATSFATCAMALAEYGVQQPGYVFTGQQAEPSPSDQPAASDTGAAATDQAACGCQDNCCCNDCCGGGLLSCCLGDPWTLKDELTPCSTINYGGWFQAGYNNDPTRLSRFYGEGLSFNDVPDMLALHQAWFYVEKEADPTCCCADWGFRFDILYGTDAQKTQAFGNELNRFGDPRGWDNPWDYGVYGWAIPQLYGEVAYGDWSIIAGHFFTIEGYEVVPAPENFFFSHSLTMFNSEPFTHTGVYAGWTLGWDTGFDQYGAGNNFLGGVKAELTDDVTATYTCTGGNLGWRSPDGDGYSHSVVIEAALTDCLNYVLQSDYVHSDYARRFDDEDVGVDQYLFYTVNDCVALGARLEWWKSNIVTGRAHSFDEVTFGLNYRPQANLVVRPEIRYDWAPAADRVNAAAGIPYDEWVFGIDAIVTY